MSYETFKTIQAGLESAVAKAETLLSDTVTRKAMDLGISTSGPMGLTPDAIKTSPEYRSAKYRFDSAFGALRAFNGKYAKRYTKQIRADIDARRQSRIAKA